tara:strand:- start:803 stop:1168 length:366 start_codon:yes stop_codon:yes gene_type:complete
LLAIFIELIINDISWDFEVLYGLHIYVVFNLILIRIVLINYFNTVMSLILTDIFDILFIVIDLGQILTVLIKFGQNILINILLFLDRDIRGILVILMLNRKQRLEFGDKLGEVDFSLLELS